MLVNVILSRLIMMVCLRIWMRPLLFVMMAANLLKVTILVISNLYGFNQGSVRRYQRADGRLCLLFYDNAAK